MIMIGVPCYDERVHMQLANALLHELGEPLCPTFTVTFKASSLLAFCHNLLLCNALNARAQGVTHLLICHADVVPKPGFLKTLYEEMIFNGAGIMAGVLPIKDGNGLTSTALLEDAGQVKQRGPRDFRRRRVTLKELEQLPETFAACDLAKLWGVTARKPVLLVNTGLLLIDVCQPFAELLNFQINDAVWRGDDGQFYPDVESEDWAFSRMAAELNVKVCATRKVQAYHVGRENFPNFGAWGKLDVDTIGLPWRNGHNLSETIQT
jgi:hypothetical protein